MLTYLQSASDVLEDLVDDTNGKLRVVPSEVVEDESEGANVRKLELPDPGKRLVKQLADLQRLKRILSAYILV